MPPGAQLTPDRVIEAPRVSSPDAPRERVAVPAQQVTPTRDRKREAQQVDDKPPYSTGADFGRNTQPNSGIVPTSKSIVP